MSQNMDRVNEVQWLSGVSGEHKMRCRHLEDYQGCYRSRKEWPGDGQEMVRGGQEVAKKCEESGEPSSKSVASVQGGPGFERVTDLS